MKKALYKPQTDSVDIDVNVYADEVCHNNACNDFRGCGDGSNNFVEGCGSKRPSNYIAGCGGGGHDIIAGCGGGGNNFVAGCDGGGQNLVAGCGG